MIFGISSHNAITCAFDKSKLTAIYDLYVQDTAEDNEESEKSKADVDEENGQVWSYFFYSFDPDMVLFLLLKAAKEASKDPNKLKRPLSAFFVFLYV